MSQIQVTIKGLLKDLESGLTRDGIAEKYGLSKTDVKKIFMNPKLKHKKTIKVKEEAFILIDDTEEDTQAAPEATAETVEETIQEEVVQESPVEESDGVFGEE